MTFAVLLLFGVSPLHANATSTLALVPGSVSSLWGFRGSMERNDGALLLAIGIPSLVGGAVGAFLLLQVGELGFARVSPWLILAATLLFIAQEPLVRWLRCRRPERAAADASLAAPRRTLLLTVAGMQLCIAVYGGFFGSGIGILMLATFSMAGLSSIHRMNALKHLAAVLINGLAALIFVRHRCIEWGPGLLMAVAAILGGYVGRAPPCGSARSACGARWS